MAAKLKVIQYNANRRREGQHEFLRDFTIADYNIALISEPYVGRGPGVPSYQGLGVYQFTSGSRVKACVITKPILGSALGVSQLSTSNLAVIQLRVNHRPLFIVSAYVEPDEDPNDTLAAIGRLLLATQGSQLI